MVKILKSFGWNNVDPSVADSGPTLFHDRANVSCYPAYQGIKRQYGSQFKHVQSPNSVSILGQRRIQLTGIEPEMGCEIEPVLGG